MTDMKLYVFNAVCMQSCLPGGPPLIAFGCLVFGRQLRFESFRMHAGLAEVVPWTVSGLDSGMPTYPKEFQQRTHAPPGVCVCLRKEADVI